MKLHVLSLVPLVTVSASVLGADDIYSGSIAARYASNNVNTPYVPNYVVSDPLKHKNLNPFNDYVSLTLGGNCTNFASQSMVGGFSSNTTPWGAFNNRINYTADKTWYFKSDGNRGPAWTGARQMYDYAGRSNQTKGISTTRIATIKYGYKQSDISGISLGDLASLNQFGKGFEHSMIVSKIDVTVCSWWNIFCTPQRVVKVSYQNGGTFLARQDYDISNTLTNNLGIVQIFRPMKYKR